MLASAPPSTPREAAKDMLRGYVRGAADGENYTEEWIRTGSLGAACTAYWAQVEISGHVRVTCLAGQPCNARFSLHEIWTELEAEVGEYGAQQLTLF